MRSSSAVDSCCWPGVTNTPSGMPWPSHSRWILLPKPPWERPKAWSSGSAKAAADGPPRARGWSAFFFRPGGGPASADDGGVGTPQVAAQAAVTVEVFEQVGEDG